MAPGERYRETLLQKVAAGYLQAFVQPNFTQNIFLNYSVLYLDMNGDGVVNHDDRNAGEAFAKSLQLEGDAKFFIKDAVF